MDYSEIWQDWTIQILNCSNHLNTGQVWYSNGPNVSSCWIVRILNGGLKTRQKCLFYGPNGILMVRLVMWSDHLKTGQKNVWKVKCLDFMCSVFRWLLYSWIWIPDISITVPLFWPLFDDQMTFNHLNTGLVQNSDPHSIMTPTVGIRYDTKFQKHLNTRL